MRTLLLALLLLVTFTATASATIVPQRSIAGVKLGMSENEVRAALGAPKRVRHPSSDIFGRYTLLDYGLTEVSLFEDGEVFGITTTSRRERTAREVGVGSTEAAVRRRVPRVRCETIAGFRSCHVGRFDPGKVVTDFILSKRRVVKRVTLGRVID